jgi:hypothetical protein
MKVQFLEDVTVASAGTRVQVTTNKDLAVKAIIFQSDPDNDSDEVIYVGDSTVAANKGFALLPGETAVFSVKALGSNNDSLNVSDFWVDASASGQKVKVAYTTRFGG